MDGEIAPVELDDKIVMRERKEDDIPFSPAPVWMRHTFAHVEHPWWKFFIGLFFPSTIPLLLFDMGRGERILDSARTFVATAGRCFAFLITFSWAAVVYILVEYYSNEYDRISPTWEVWGAFCLHFLTCIVFSVWQLLGRDGTEFTVTPQDDQLTIHPDFFTEESRRRWQILSEYQFEVPPLQVQSVHESRFDYQFVEQCKTGKFSASTVCAYVVVAASRLARSGQIFFPFLFALAQAMFPSLYRFFADDPQPREGEFALSMICATVFFIHTWIHFFLLLNAITFYISKRRETIAVAAMLYSQPVEQAAGFDYLPDLNLAEPTHMAAFSKIRLFLQTVKDKRFKRYQFHGSAILFPFIVVSLYFLLLQFTNSSATINMTDMSLAILAFDMVVIGGTLFASLIIAADVNALEDSHLEMTLRTKYALSEQICYSEFKGEDTKKLAASRNLLGDLIGLMDLSGGSCTVLGFTVDYTNVYSAFIFVLSLASQLLYKHYFGE